MKKVDPTNPIRSDHRLIKDILEKQGEVVHRAEEYETITKVFLKMGGSWSRIFKGSPDDIVLLKKICKVAVSKGFVSKGGFMKRNPKGK